MKRNQCRFEARFGGFVCCGGGDADAVRRYHRCAISVRKGGGGNRACLARQADWEGCHSGWTLADSQNVEGSFCPSRWDQSQAFDL